jgi:peptidyl-prolyl cis-trans isomerase SurA
MKRILYFLIILTACQPVPNTTEDAWLFKVNDTPVYPDEFLYAYNKNKFNNDSIDRGADVREYLDLYVNFKLKVTEAKALGLDTGRSYKRELEGYRKQLAAPYLSESSVTEKLLLEAYERMKEEIRASHILINVPPTRIPEDTLKAYELINKVRELALQGEDFGNLAIQYSQDPSVKRNKGDLGYFSSLQMGYPFEEAAYSTPVDSISPIIKTRFGYHILKVTDRRPSRGQVKVSHIMLRATNNISSEDSIRVFEKINDIHQQITTNQINWKDACSQFSEDINTRNTGGVLPWLGSGNVPPSFENAAFRLTTVGDISDPVKTPFGWHIIKLDMKKGLDPFEEMKPELERRIKRDERAKLSEKAFYDRVRKENNFREFPNSLDKAIKQLDSTLLVGKWRLRDTLETDTIFIIGSDTYSIHDFLTYIRKNQRANKNQTLASLAETYYENFVNLSLKSYEEAHLGEKHFEYKMLYQEYAEGIILFQLMDSQVWSKAIEDTSGLKRYYEENISDYLSNGSVNGTLYNLSSDSLRLVLQEMIDRKEAIMASKNELKSYFNEKSPLNLLIEEGSFDNSNPLIQKITEKSPGIYNLDVDGRFYLLDIESVSLPEPRPMNEIRGQLISDYQEYLEEEWIRKLRATYPVEINEEVLEKVIRDVENR